MFLLVQHIDAVGDAEHEAEQRQLMLIISSFKCSLNCSWPVTLLQQ